MKESMIQSREVSRAGGGMRRSCTSVTVLGPDPDEDEAITGSRLWQCALAVEHSWQWGVLVRGVILASVVEMSVEAQWPSSLQFISDVVCDPEDFFLAFFSFELALRLFVLGSRGFFCEEDWMHRHWNWFDLFIVLAGLVSLVFQPHISKATVEFGPPHPNEVTGGLLLLRSARVLRVVRLGRRYRQLNLVLRGLIKSFESVFWINLLGFLIMLLFAIFFTITVGRHHELWNTEECDYCQPEDEDDIKRHFGSLFRSLNTMVRFVIMDSWNRIIGLVAKRLWFTRFVFMAYTLVVSFTLTSLLTGIIAENVSTESSTALDAEREAAVRAYTAELRLLFKSRRSELTEAQLVELLEDPRVFQQLERLELQDLVSSSEVQELFPVMDRNNDGKVTWKEFSRGLSRMQGLATSRELALLHADVLWLLRPLQRLETLVARKGRIKALESRLERLEASVAELLRSQAQHLSL